MRIEWIAAVASIVAVLAWCRVRRSERAILAHCPASTKLKIHLPMIPWRDWVSPNDHEVLQAVRTRANLGGVLLLAIVLTASIFAHVPEPVAPSTRSMRHAGDEKPMEALAPSDPIEAAVAQPDPMIQPEAEYEPLEELRRPSRLYGTAKVKPVYRLHNVEGARITDIDPNSFWAMLGVREGDVVIEIHGAPVDNSAALVALMNVLERDEHVALAVRGPDGEVRYLEFRVPDDL